MGEVNGNRPRDDRGTGISRQVLESTLTQMFIGLKEGGHNE